MVVSGSRQNDHGFARITSPIGWQAGLVAPECTVRYASNLPRGYMLLTTPFKQNQKNPLIILITLLWRFHVFHMFNYFLLGGASEVMQLAVHIFE